MASPLPPAAQLPLASRASDWRDSGRVWTGLAVALALFAAAWTVTLPRELLGISAYLPLHSAMEMFAIFVAMLVAAICWSSQRRVQPMNLFLLYFPFAAVGLLDFAHMISYPDMPGLASAGTTSKAIQYWLAARLVAALALLGAILASERPLRVERIRGPALAAVLAVAGVFVAVVEFREASLPEVYIEGVGLTAFKIAAELAIVALHVATALVLYARRGKGNLPETTMFAILGLLALGELCFTLYVQVQDVFNILGHVYKVAGYYLLFRVAFRDAVERPLVELRQSRDDVRELTRHEALIREEEKARIGREIHDELGSTLTAMRLQLHRLEQRTPGLGAAGDAILKQAQALLDDAESTVQRVATELRPRIIDDLGLVAALEWQLGEFARRHLMAGSFDAEPQHVALDTGRAVALYRIAQEALTNVAKHAQASEVSVELKQDEQGVSLRIADNGRGLAAAARPPGARVAHGLRGMQERARQCGGELALAPGEGGGTVVSVRIPAPQASLAP